MCQCVTTRDANASHPSKIRQQGEGWQSVDWDCTFVRVSRAPNYTESTLWYMTTWTVTTFCQTMRRGLTTNYFHVTVLTTSGLGLCVLKRRRNMMDYQSMKENSLSSLWTPHQNWKWKCFLLEVCKSPNVDWLYNQMWRVLQSLDWLTDWLPHKQVQFTNILLLERLISHVTRSCLYKHLL